MAKRGLEAISDGGSDELVQLLEADPNASSGTSENNFDRPQLIECLEALERKYCAPLGAATAALEAANRFDRLADYQSGTLFEMGKAGLDEMYKKKEFALVRLKFQFLRQGLIDLNGAAFMQDMSSMEYKKSFIRVHACLRRLYDCLCCDLMARKTLDPTWASECPNKVDPFGLTPFDITKLSDYQSFIVYVLESLQSRGYKRYREACYVEIETDLVDVVSHTGEKVRRKFKTHAWRRVMDIREFVLKSAPKETHFAQWQHMLSGNNLDATVRYLGSCVESNFEELRPDRHWHSFKNGIYFTKKAQFYPWGHKDILADAVACKFHDVDFDTSILEFENFMDIPTNGIQKVLEWQMGEVPEEHEPLLVIMWIYVFVGRLLFEVNEMDQWQVIPFIIGVAGTGKSLLLKAAGWFFPDEDVETLANNTQKGFGLETFVDKLMWRCLEVKHDFGLDQAQLQSMVTGEEMSIMRKMKSAINVVWKAPGIMCGNELANWSDNSGSISRRLVITYFDRKVQTSDPHLDKKIQRDIGALLHKCCKAYLGAVSDYGALDLWADIPWPLPDNPKARRPVLPKYFHVNKKNLKEQTHAVESFLRNDERILLIDNTSRGMPWSIFMELANGYFKAKNMPTFNWSKEDKYKSTLKDFTLPKKKITREHVFAQGGSDKMMYDGKAYDIGADWLFGVLEKRTVEEVLEKSEHDL